MVTRSESETVTSGAERPPGRAFQVDALRAFAIVSVILIHSVLPQTLIDTWAVFHIWQAVPIFIALMGLTSYWSYSRILDRGDSRPAARYAWSRVERLILPFGILWLAMLLVGLQRGDAYFGPLLLALRTPVQGPGNYFVPLAVQFAALTPIMVRLYRRWPLLTFVVSVALNLAFEALGPLVPLIRRLPYVYSAVSLRYLALFVAGMWVASRFRHRDARFWSLVTVWAVFSSAYLIYVNLTGDNLFFWDAWRWQNIFSFGYTIAMIAVAIQLLPQRADRILARGIGYVAASSYHIFLFQMLYFVLVPPNRASLLVLNLVVCLGAGMLWHSAESLVKRGVRSLRKGTP